MFVVATSVAFNVAERLKSLLRTRWALVVLFLLALAVRLYRLDAQSFWNDEGTSVALAARSLATITRNASHDIHPPLYYYLLHFWVAILGNSEFAARSLSALLGALLVVVIYILGKHLYGTWVAWTASLCAMISPLQVYYSQEARMYILVTLLGALSFWFFLCWRELLYRPCHIGLAYIATTVLAMYSHYFAFTLIVAENALFALRWIVWAVTSLRRPGRSGSLKAAWKPLVTWILSQAAIVLIFAPWLLVAWKQLRAWPAVSEPFGLLTLLQRVLYAFSVGTTIKHAPWMAIGFGLILLLGWGITLVVEVQRRERITGLWAAAVVWLYLLLPVAIMYVLSRQRPMYNPKFLLLATPAYAILLGRAVTILPLLRLRAWTARWASAVWLVATSAFVVSLSLASLRSYYYDARYARDNYRGIARYIEAVETGTDAILINAPGQYETFLHYYRGKSSLHPLPRQRPIDTTVTERDLQEMVASREHVYAILWATNESDPQRFIEGWMDQHTYKASDVWYGNVRLVVYAVPTQASEVLGDFRSLKVNLGDQVSLEGYALLTPQATAGEVLQITLFWKALARMDKRYKVFIHILDEGGHIVGQRDAEPGGGARITTTWQVGEELMDNYGVLILPGTPPGVYQIMVGMYELDSSQRLPVVGASGNSLDRVLLGPITVHKAALPPPPAALDMQREVKIPLGPITLLGYNLAKLGQEHLPDAPLYAGDILHLALFWQAMASQPNDVELTLQLLDSSGQVRLTHRSAPVEGRYPLSRWQAGEIVRDQHHLFLPADLRPGTYRLLLSIQEMPPGRQLFPPRLLHKLTIH